jgi:hypothetical protein
VKKYRLVCSGEVLRTAPFISHLVSPHTPVRRYLCTVHVAYLNSDELLTQLVIGEFGQGRVWWGRFAGNEFGGERVRSDKLVGPVLREVWCRVSWARTSLVGK